MYMFLVTFDQGKNSDGKWHTESMHLTQHLYTGFRALVCSFALNLVSGTFCSTTLTPANKHTNKTKARTEHRVQETVAEVPPKHKSS